MRNYKGLTPVGHEDGIYWSPTHLWENDVAYWRYGIAQYAFVPGYNVIRFGDDPDEYTGYTEDEYVISNHKTLTEAKAILTLLLATPGAIRYDD